MGGETFGRVLNGTFILGGAQDGAKKFGKEVSSNQPYNEYDEIMDNEIKPVKEDFMGNTNPSTIHPEASEAIDKLYREKLAYGEEAQEDFNRYSATPNYNSNKAYGQNKVYGQNKNYNSYDNNAGNDYLPYAVLGSLAVGLGAYQAYKKGDIMAPINTFMGGAKAGLEKGLLSAPKKLIKTNKTGKLLFESISQSNKSMKNLESSMSKPRYNKFASEEIDEMYKEARAEFANNKEFVKTLVKEDFIQNGLRSVPYATVPIALSYALNKNLKKDNSSVRGADSKLVTPSDKIIIDVPLEALNKSTKHKKASEEIDSLMQEKIAYEPITMREWAKHELPRQAVKASSWALFPAGLIALTHRNIRGMGERIDRAENVGPVEPGKARITIEAGPSTQNYDYKMASEVIEELYKEAAKDSNLSSAVEEDLLQITGEKKDEGIPFQRKKLTNNVKKKEEMLK